MKCIGIILLAAIAAVAGVNANESENVVLDNDYTCDACVYVFETAQELLEDPESQEEIKRYLHEVCQWLPSSYERVACDLAVNYYYPRVVEYILENDALDACVEYNMCSVEDCELLRATEGVLGHLNTWKSRLLLVEVNNRANSLCEASPRLLL